MTIIIFLVNHPLVRYKYSKDDEEIYKEFMEINNELIPHILKTEGISATE